MTRNLARRALVGAVLAAAGAAQAAVFDFSGNIENHNDVVRIAFSLDSDASGVKVWTDSYQNNTNFDPITAVWRVGGGDATLVGSNDDNAGIAPGQTRYDSGLVFGSLAAGDYFFTIATFNNFNLGSLLSDGFAFDNQTPVPLSQWCQPANDCGPGSFWSVHLAGVSDAEGPGGGSVPEPQSPALVLAGLGALGIVARRRKA